MNNLIDNDTEQQLSELTRWTDESPELYKVALEEHCAAQATPLLKREFHFSSFSGRPIASCPYLRAKRLQQLVDSTLVECGQTKPLKFRAHYF